MHIESELTRAVIPGELVPPSDGLCGAWVEFRGLVRNAENDRRIAALEYEAYEPMATAEMTRIIAELSASWSCLAVRVIHRIGIVPVGEAAIYIGIAARHRAEAFALLSEFMDRLKLDVPIWKVRALAPDELQVGPAL